MGGPSALTGHVPRAQVDFAPGDFLMRQGAPADCMFYIEQGEVLCPLALLFAGPARPQPLLGCSLWHILGFYQQSHRGSQPGGALSLNSSAASAPPDSC